MKKLLVLTSLVLSLHAFAGPQGVLTAIESIGEQRTAVIFLDLLEDGKEPSVELFHEAIFGQGKSVKNFIKEVSHGKAWVTGKTYPWLKIKASGKTCYLTSEEILETVIQHKLLDLNDVDRLLVFNHLNYDGECLKKNSFGFSTLGKSDFEASIGKVRLSIAQFWAHHRFVLPKLPAQPISGISSSVIAHEFGHSLGLTGHSNTLDCGNTSISFDRSECKQSAIADMFNLMAGEGFFRPALHYSACHKEDLGWIHAEDESLLTLNKEETLKSTVVKLKPYTSASGLVALRINLDSPIPVPCVNPNNCKVNIPSLFLEFRTAQGFDENLSKLSFESEKYFNHIVFAPEFYGTSKEIKTNGIQIRGGFFKDQNCMTSYNIDVTPQSLHSLNPTNGEVTPYSLYDNLDSFLTVGKTFIEPVNGLQITVQEIDQDGNAVLEILY